MPRRRARGWRAAWSHDAEGAATGSCGPFPQRDGHAAINPKSRGCCQCVVILAGMGTHVRFGSFELDEDRAELRRSGELVRLPPQPFKALLLMIDRPGCLVTREELRRTLWGDGRFVDFDAGLNFCIRQLRAALGDPASQSAVIVAVPRRGYKFVAPIEPVV